MPSRCLTATSRAASIRSCVACRRRRARPRRRRRRAARRRASRRRGARRRRPDRRRADRRAPTPTLARRARSRRRAASTTSRAGVLDAASPVRTPSGVVAIAAWRPRPLERRASRADGARASASSTCRIPGNVGSVIRSADALGATGVLALDGTADPGGWKALRGAMGSTFRLPVARGALADDAVDGRARRGLRGRRHDRRATATPLDAGRPRGADRRALLGSEGAGLPDAIVDARRRARDDPDARAASNSLNVAVDRRAPALRSPASARRAERRA